MRPEVIGRVAANRVGQRIGVALHQVGDGGVFVERTVGPHRPHELEAVPAALTGPVGKSGDDGAIAPNGKLGGPLVGRRRPAQELYESTVVAGILVRDERDEFVVGQGAESSLDVPGAAPVDYARHLAAADPVDPVVDQRVGLARHHHVNPIAVGRDRRRPQLPVADVPGEQDRAPARGEGFVERGERLQLDHPADGRVVEAVELDEFHHRPAHIHVRRAGDAVGGLARCGERQRAPDVVESDAPANAEDPPGLPALGRTEGSRQCEG